MSSSIQRTKPILILCVLLLIFFGPLLVAWLLFHSGYRFDNHTMNHGRLLKPMIPLKQLVLTTSKQQPYHAPPHKWLLLYVSPTHCQSSCLENLYKMRQMRLALGKDAQRIGRVLVTPNGFASERLDAIIAHDYAGSQRAYIKPTQQQQLWARARLPLPTQGQLFVVDPQGELMLTYAAGAAPSGMLLDLKRLLKVSQIG